MKVLLVEDAAIISERVRAEINNMNGVRVVACTDDVTPAIEALSMTQPDLVILDICLKTSDGTELITYIIQEYPQIKIFVYSNIEDAALREVYLAQGANRVFDKAFEFFDMIEAVCDLAMKTH